MRVSGLFLFLGLAVAPAVAGAQDNPVYVTGGAGYFDLGAAKTEPAPTLQIQVSPGTRSLVEGAPRGLDEPAPVSGGAALQGSGGAVGLGVQLPFGESFTFTPSLAVGPQDQRLGLAPGATTEYRSGAELSYQFSNDWKLGAGLYHYSDGPLASEREDSGMVTFSFTVPFGR